jgi:hypothetical protein
MRAIRFLAAIGTWVDTGIERLSSVRCRIRDRVHAAAHAELPVDGPQRGPDRGFEEHQPEGDLPLAQSGDESVQHIDLERGKARARQAVRRQDRVGAGRVRSGPSIRDFVVRGLSATRGDR